MPIDKESVEAITAYVESWFPTEILVCDAPSFLADTKAMFDATDFDKYRTNAYPNGATTYFYGQGLPRVSGRDWTSFETFLESVASSLAERQGVNTANNPAKLGSIWLSRMDNGGIHAKHAHAAAHYSGTYYVNTPDGSGMIRLHNPIADLWGLAMPPVAYDGKPQTSMYVDYTPRPGLLLVWNSWLYHEVLPNQSTEPRDSISFNFTCGQLNP